MGLKMTLSKLQRDIIELKKNRNALILAHSYQPIEIQEIADLVDDSLALARAAERDTEHDMILLSGVDFMAEGAAILNPHIPVYVPEPSAGCVLANFGDIESIKQAKEQYPDAPVVLYVNTTAEAKALADIICTSRNAVDVVRSLNSDVVLFGPDINLAEFVRRQVPEIKIIDINPIGHCSVHQFISVDDILRHKKMYPNAEVIVHPECPPKVQDVADFVASTSLMVERVKNSDKKVFIIGTEIGLVERLQVENPDKIIIAAKSNAICVNMKKNTLEKILYVLKELPESHRVIVPEEIAEKASQALKRMTQIYTHASVKSK